MVVPSLSIGALVGIALSGGFVYWEVGRYATPQVSVTRFDERRELFAYTAGLFVGVPFAIAYVLFGASMANGALLGALLVLAAFAVGGEVAQWGLVRTRYWGRGESRPFYVLGYRAAIGGIVALAITAQSLGAATVTLDGTLLALLDAVAVFALQVAAALLALRTAPAGGRTGGGPVSAAALVAGGVFLVGLGPLVGEPAAFAAGALALGGAVLAYRRLRPLLAEVPPPNAGPPPLTPPESSRYGRIDRPRVPPGRIRGP